jgi:hypothetical protein
MSSPTMRRALAALLATAFLGLSPSANAAQPNTASGKKAYFDTGEGLDVEYRSFALGFLSNVMLEMDVYLTEKWVAGINGTFEVEFDEEACISDCRKQSRLTLFGERLWGGRWGHVGLRAGPFLGRLYHNFTSDDGREFAHVGPIFGLNAGASATFTPTRWAGVTLTASAFPGLFVGERAEGHCWGCFNDETAVPARSFELSGMVAVLVRVGDLDGPERECSKCGPAPTEAASPEPTPESTFLPNAGEN